MGGLFKTIEDFLKATNLMRKGGMGIPRRLFHVDLLIGVTMKKGIFDIQLMYGPVFGYRNA